MNTDKSIAKLQAARKAYKAYEKALAAASEIIAEKPPKGLGATVMMPMGFAGTHRGGEYKCAECEHTTRERNWKYCPYCGSEILRWDEPEPDPNVDRPQGYSCSGNGRETEEPTANA